MSAERDEETMDLLSAWLDAAPGNGVEITSVPSAEGPRYLVRAHHLEARHGASGASPHLGDALQQVLTEALEGPSADPG